MAPSQRPWHRPCMWLGATLDTNESPRGAEIWQAVNPFFVIVLTPLIMLLFSTLSKKGIEISTPRKIAIGMGLAAVAYLFLMVISWVMDYPSADIFKSMPLSETAGIIALDFCRSGSWFDAGGGDAFEPPRPTSSNRCRSARPPA